MNFWPIFFYFIYQIQLFLNTLEYPCFVVVYLDELSFGTKRIFKTFDGLETQLNLNEILNLLNIKL